MSKEKKINNSGLECNIINKKIIILCVENNVAN